MRYFFLKSIFYKFSTHVKPAVIAPVPVEFLWPVITIISPTSNVKLKSFKSIFSPPSPPNTKVAINVPPVKLSESLSYNTQE